MLRPLRLLRASTAIEPRDRRAYAKAPARESALRARFEDEPHVNPNTGTAEFSLRDPDGYYVTISAL